MKKILYGNSKNIVWHAVRQYRTKIGMSQGELAARMQTMGVNIDQQMVSRIENNERFVTDYELACLCRIFMVDANEMLKSFVQK